LGIARFFALHYCFLSFAFYFFLIETGTNYSHTLLYTVALVFWLIVFFERTELFGPEYIPDKKASGLIFGRGLKVFLLLFLSSPNGSLLLEKKPRNVGGK